MVRMHYREAAINALLEAGIEVSVLGRGWSNFPVKDAQKLNILGDRIPSRPP